MNQYTFSDAINNTSKSFIREILKVTQSDHIISFAGGLPNKALFPVKQIQAAANKVLEEDGANVLQYSTSEGYLPLRQWIADRYRRYNLTISPEQILITSGSQQALDLIGKLFLNVGDNVVVEHPSYLGAIQAFQMYQPRFHSVPLTKDGIDLEKLNQVYQQHQCKFFYGVPNFQNPTGLTYSRQNRQELGEWLNRTQAIMIEDNPYGELRFMGEDLFPVYKWAPERTIMLGSFSKICSPGLRLGWMVVPEAIMDKLIVAKQAADLHTSYLTQRILAQYLQDNSMDEHISKIKAAYAHQRHVMVEALSAELPEITATHPEGGMFLWLTLPENWSATDLFYIAIRHGVAFVPGEPFFANEIHKNHLRMSYCTADEAEIREGIRRLSAAISEYRQSL
ncbi:PLP-dependent aminotransferase family protein [Neisseriaceae bacterium ESL0693]|nr:PLP-dependent aminotransferase family protein [Neisseriaceae bacterium ESL0693]